MDQTEYIPFLTDNCANHGECAVYGVGLQPLNCWHHGLESCWGHGCSSHVFCMLYR